MGWMRNVVNQILQEFVRNLEAQALTSSAEYKRFLVSDLEAQKLRYHQKLATLLPMQVREWLRCEEGLRKVNELLARINGAMKEAPIVEVNAPSLTVNTVNVQQILAEVDAWTPPAEIAESHEESCPPQTEPQLTPSLS